ncbi:MAG: alpha/beta hydrolase, partial [Planctomycetes bacterium]|nr:alpha/beta hydrolase [Planctomycetota bacterium]
MRSSASVIFAIIITNSLAAQQPVGKEFVYRKAGDKEMKLYVVFPSGWKSEDRRPAIVFFHHGSWIVGKPTQFNEHSKYLATRGMVAVQVDYRLLERNGTEPPIPCIEDARSSMRWVRTNAGKLGIDPERIASAGGSAGGHLASIVGMMDGFDAPGDDLKVSPRSNAMILYDPVFDNGPGKWGHQRVKERYKEFSPFYNVGPKLPPSLIIVGEKDGLIPPKIVNEFAAAMTKAGNRCEAVVYPGK